MDIKRKPVITDGSRIIIESCVESGAEVFIGYPITPANLLYHYASQRFPVFIPAPDEISCAQWSAGFSATGKFPVIATSFPGFALMLESINMSHMMELPMLIILAQRLGPSTGSATVDAQGDVHLLRGMISGGYPVPVFCPSNLKDCWELTHDAIRMAVELRTPVILLTSKEMVMTECSYDLSRLDKITPIDRPPVNKNKYQPYLADEGPVPPFLPLGDHDRQVKFNASTHDATGYISRATSKAIENTQRLKMKIEDKISSYTYYHYDHQEGSECLIVTYGNTSEAVRDAVRILREQGEKVSALIMKTLLPVPTQIIDILNEFKNLVFVEENISGQMREILYGQVGAKNVHSVNRIGKMINPGEVVEEVTECLKAY